MYNVHVHILQLQQFTVKAYMSRVVVAQWQSTGGYNQTAWVRFPATASVFFFSKKSLLGSRWGDGICGALVQFGCYQHIY